MVALQKHKSFDCAMLAAAPGTNLVGETLAWEEVLSFYIQFVLQKSIEKQIKKVLNTKK